MNYPKLDYNSHNFYNSHKFAVVTPKYNRLRLSTQSVTFLCNYIFIVNFRFKVSKTIDKPATKVKSQTNEKQKIQVDAYLLHYTK